jgi:hypothetical protein
MILLACPLTWFRPPVPSDGSWSLPSVPERSALSSADPSPLYRCPWVPARSIDVLIRSCSWVDSRENPSSLTLCWC